MSADKQKSIDDLYKLLSVTIDLQKQILTQLKNFESNQDAPVEKANPGTLSSLQKEMLRWILNSDSIKSITNTDPSDLQKEIPVDAFIFRQETLLEADRSSPSSFENVSSKLIAYEYTKRMNADQEPVTTTSESAYPTVTAADDSDNDTVRFVEERLRDIIKTPKNAKEATGDGKIPTDLIRLHGMIAILLTETQGREIDIHEKIVTVQYENLKEVSKKVYASMIESISKKNTIQDAATLRWSEIPARSKNKFMAKLERRAKRKLDLDIGRCQDMWAANVLLYKLVGARRKTITRSNNRHINVMTYSKVGDNTSSPVITDGSNNASDAESNIKLDTTLLINQDSGSDVNLDANTPINLDNNGSDYAALPINRASENLDYTLPINQENGFNISSSRPLNESNDSNTPLRQCAVGEKRSGIDEESRTDEEHKNEKKLKCLVA